MQNFKVHSISFCPRLLITIELIVRDPRISSSGEMFESVCLNYAVKTILVEKFIATQKIVFFLLQSCD